MPLASTNFYVGGPIKAADMIQFFNLFTGVMTDQPVTFANTLTVGGSQSVGSVPLRVSSVAAGTAQVFEARTLQGDVNPVFSVGRTGVLSFGAGGGTVTDTTITRSGANALTFSGATTVNGQLIAGGGFLQFNGASPQIVGGTVDLNFRNNANNATNVNITDAGLVTVRAGLTVTAGNVGVGVAPVPQYELYVGGSTTSGSITQTGIAVGPTFPSSATSFGIGVQSGVVTAAAAFTMGAAYDFYASTITKGAGSAITTAGGLYIEAQTVGGTSNYGIYVNTPSGGSGANMGIRVVGGTPAIQIDTGGFLIGGGTVQLGPGNLGFFNSTPLGKVSVGGSRGANIALANLLTALNNMGLVTDGSTV